MIFMRFFNVYQALLFPFPREARASPYAGKRTGDEAGGGGGGGGGLVSFSPPLASIGCSTSHKIRPPSFVRTPNLLPLGKISAYSPDIPKVLNAKTKAACCCTPGPPGTHYSKSCDEKAIQ